jgi:hypothetical protein
MRRIPYIKKVGYQVFTDTFGDFFDPSTSCMGSPLGMKASKNDEIWIEPKRVNMC